MLAILNQAPPALPAGPIWDRFLFENPWPLAGLVVVAGLAWAWSLNRSSRAPQAMGVGGVTLAIAAGLVLLSRAITTDREAIRAHTTELVEAAARVQGDQLQTLLAPNAQASDPRNVIPISFPDAGPPREELINRIEQHLGGSYKLKGWSISRMEATLDGPDVGRSQFRFTATPESLGFPFSSWWRFDWRRNSDGSWSAFHLEPLVWEPPLGVK